MKKKIIEMFISVAVMVTVLFAVCIGAFAQEQTEDTTDLFAFFDETNFGDANQDGKITAADARVLLKCAAGLQELSSHILIYGDYNKDNAITAADARIALRVSASLENIECFLRGHIFSLSLTVAPDCVNNGYTTNKCIRCSATDGSKKDIVSALGHKLKTTKTDATCTKAGWITVKCTVCGYVDKDCENGKALGHSFSLTVYDAYTIKNCTRCNHFETEYTDSKNQKVIYLTFDDGPGPYTEKLLGYLRKYGVKATFFVTNQNPNYTYLLKTMADDGHAIGVHSLTHNWNIYSSESSYLKDFNAMYDIIKKQTGIETKIFRFPGGTNNTVSRSYSRGIMSKLVKTMTDKGFVYFDWNVDCYDTSGYNSSQIARTTINQIKNKSVSIVLMHDIKKSTVNAIPEIIEYGLANGYVFKALDHTSPNVQFKPVN